VELADRVHLVLRLGRLIHLSWFGAVPLFYWMGVRQPLALTAFFALEAVCAGLCFVPARRRESMRWLLCGLVTVNAVCLMTLTGVVGPLALVPALALGHTLPALIHPDRVVRGYAALMGTLSVLLPAWLDWLGCAPAAYGFEQGAVQVLPRLVALDPRGVTVLLAIGAVGPIVLSWFLLGRIAETLAHADRRLYLHAWQLEQLLPTAPSPRRGA
jgi:hypothetical protein